VLICALAGETTEAFSIAADDTESHAAADSDMTLHQFADELAAQCATQQQYRTAPVVASLSQQVASSPQMHFPLECSF